MNLLRQHPGSTIGILLYIAWWLFYIYYVKFTSYEGDGINYQGGAAVMFSFFLFFVYLITYTILLLAAKRNSRKYYAFFLLIILSPLIIILSLINFAA